MKLKTLFLSLPIFLLAATSGFADNFDNVPKLTLNGEASFHVEADQMEVSLGVVTRASQSAKAMNQNNQLMNQVIANLKSLGLDETEYKTCHFHIQPVYKRSKDGCEENQVISGYEVYNSIQVKTLKLELADQILSAAVQGGANQVNQINFSLSNPQKYRGEVIQAAAQSALADATILADAAGVKIKRVLGLSLNHWQTLPAPYMLSKHMNGGTFEMGHDAIEPGKAEIHATVSVVYEIGS